MNCIKQPFRYQYKRRVPLLIGIQCFVLFLTKIQPFVYTFCALTPVLVIRTRMYWQVFTYQFLHGDFWHLVSNMFGLFIFGTAIEKKIGSSEFLVFYLLVGTLCGITACFSYALIGLYRVSLVGASGVIFALLYLFAVLFPKSIIYVFGIIPVPAPLLVILYAGIELYDMLFTRDSIAHSVHLSGLFFAWLYIRIRFNIKPMKIWGILR